MTALGSLARHKQHNCVCWCYSYICCLAQPIQLPNMQLQEYPFCLTCWCIQYTAILWCWLLWLLDVQTECHAWQSTSRASDFKVCCMHVCVRLACVANYVHYVSDRWVHAMCARAIGTRHCVRETTAATRGVSKDPLLAGGCCVQMHLTLQVALFLVSLFQYMSICRSVCKGMELVLHAWHA